MESSTIPETSSIKPIDRTTVHKIASGQVVIDLQTAVKELVENSLDAGATNIEVRFKQYGLTNVEVIDNGCGIAEKDWGSVGLKHYTSKLSTFEDLSTVRTFGFRGEALSSLCALCDSVVVITTTGGPMGVQLELEKSGKVGKMTRVARQRGTTVQLVSLFATLPVRRKELQRNIKREFGKALGLLNAYALGPCAGMDGSGYGVRLTVSNQLEKGQRVVQIKTDGTPTFKASLTGLWGPKAMENIIDLNMDFRVPQETSVLRRINDKYSASQGYRVQTQGQSRSQGQADGQAGDDNDAIPIRIKGLISKFVMGAGRTGTDRQFFYVNGRPCNLTKVQKAFNEIYRTFNANQAPFVLADFIVPTECCDINVSPDKRTIFLQNEGNLIDGLKAALETTFSSHRSTFNLNPTQLSQRALTQTTFDSPFSKRLNVKASGLSKSQSLPVPASSKDAGEDGRRDHEAPDGALFLPDPDGAEYSQLTAGKAAQGTVSQAGDVVEEATSTGKDRDNAKKSRDVGDAMQMDVDEGEGSPEKEKRKDVEKPAVADTTKAIWSQFTRKEKAPERRDTDVDVPEEASVPVAKKRRIEGPEMDQVGTNASTTKVINDEKCKKSSKNTSPLDSLRSRLASFASFAKASGQAASVAKLTKKAPVSSVEDEEMVDQLDEDDDSESVGGRREDGRRKRDSLHGVEVIKPSVKVVALRKEVQKESKESRMQVESHEDIVMEDPVPSTSSTIEVPQGPTDIQPEKRVQRPEVIRNADTAPGNVTLSLDLERLASAWKRLRKKSVANSDEVSCVSGKVSADAGVKNIEDNESAVCALARVIDKADFANMNIIGQFNLGFIIVRKQKMERDRQGGKDGVRMDDLFIIDQHASDEKYNFETLQQTTRIQSQKLFKPHLLELTAADELVAIENMDTLQQNGFELQIDEVAEAGQGAKLKVTAFPVSKSTEFDTTDLEELIHLMRDQPSGRIVRCSKARAMFAMRACRKSVMIGMPLNKSQMTTIVQHMGTIDQPWNCPHGRPTMRHLTDLCQDSLQRQFRPVDWSSLAGKR